MDWLDSYVIDASLEAERLSRAALLVSDNSDRADRIARLASVLQDHRGLCVLAVADFTMPWQVLAVIQGMEASGDFSRHPHNGDSLDHPTRKEPAGRPRGPGPFSWIESARDLLALKEPLFPPEWTVGNTLYFLEIFNGIGYRRRGIRSPYIWSWTTHEEPGRYVRDHEFDPAAVSHQPGAWSVLRALGRLNGLSLAE